MARGHPYRDGTHGRSISTRSGVGGVSITATLRCSQCGVAGARSLRAVMPPDQIDRKFIQAGWRIYPDLCPTCAKPQKDKPMTATPSPAAIKAQANMFTLLSQHFDPERGRYVPDWSDKVIAGKCSLSTEHVAAFRIEAFGEIKESPEIAELRADIASLVDLEKERRATFDGEVVKLRDRLARVSAAAGIPA